MWWLDKTADWLFGVIDRVFGFDLDPIWLTDDEEELL